MNYKVNIKTLKKIWNLLKQHELQGLLDGSLDIPMSKLINTIFENDICNKFCELITGEVKDYEELDIEELKELIQGFFLKISGILKGVD